MKRIVFLLFFVSSLCKAQIPTRLIENPGFELPSLGCTNCYNLYPQASVPGWSTTDPSGQIEIWGNNFQSRPSHSGSQFAEINANNPSFLYQELCLAANEVVNYSIWYLKRTTNTEQMRAQLTDVNNAVISQSPILTATTSWTNITGTLTNNGTAGTRRIGFVAVTGGSTGNLIDDITISIRPIISLNSITSSTVQEGQQTIILVHVNGVLKSSATVAFNFSGTSTPGSDYTIGTPTRGSITTSGNDFILTLPAGDYSPNVTTGTQAGVIAIPVNTTIDGLSEPSETFTYVIGSISGGGNGNTSLDLVSSISGIGANCSAPVNSLTGTITNYSPLPVEMCEMKIECLNSRIIMDWITCSESNSDFFSIQRSGDLSSWEEIGRVKAAGYSSSVNYYSFNTREDLYSDYYRLVQYDFNGNNKSYLFGKNPCKKKVLLIKDEKYIRIITDEILFLSVYNLLGQKENTYLIETDTNILLSPGFYLYELRNSKDAIIKKGKAIF